MEGKQLLKTAAYGALAGLAGTLVIQAARTATDKWAPQASAPIHDDPGQTIIKSIEGVLPQEIRDRIPKALENVAASMLPLGYGSTGAALYTSLRSDPALLTDGAALGGAIWAAGYLGWLPAIGLMPPVHKQKPAQVAASLLQHVLFGVATVSAYRKLKSAVA